MVDLELEKKMELKYWLQSSFKELKMAINLRNISDKDLVALHKERLSKYKKEVSIIRDKEHKLSTKMPDLMSGDVDDINKIIWPFYFTTPFVEVLPSTSISRYISITQEAAFVWTALTRTVFEKVEVGPGVFEWNYVDPNDPTDGIVEEFEVSFSDAQSSRTFFHDPISLNHFGYGTEPTKLDSPMLIPANNNIEVKFFNNNSTRTYIPFITFYGYRLRIKDGRDILGLMNK